jgi:hypothetical protein
MEARLREALAYFGQLTWEHWESQARQREKVRSSERASFGDVYYYELFDGKLVRVEWTMRVFEPRALKRARQVLGEIVSDDSQWSNPIVWGDPFHVAHEEDALVLHRWIQTDIYLALRQEGDEIPFRLCLDTTLRSAP